jgi:hypothetical protein
MVYNTQNYWSSGLCPKTDINKTRTRRFGNWICFRHQVMGERRLLCWVLWKEVGVCRSLVTANVVPSHRFLSL